MKKITISGREFEYKIFFDSRWDEYETHFYLGTKKETFRKYLFFGPKITVDMPILAFKFNDSIESNRYSKEELKKKLEKKVELLDRQAEIDRGELI